MNKRKLSAFTLIELLFVIAILSVMISLGVSYTAKQTEKDKINKSALQIQQILQAAMAYHVDKGDWPVASGTDVDTPSNFNTDYIGKGIRRNPWGTDQYFYTPYGPTRALFSVRSNYPTLEIAQRVAALLPNATVDPKGPAGYPVTAQVGMFAGSGGGTTIQNVGTMSAMVFQVKGEKLLCNPVDLSNVHCRPNQTADLFVAIYHTDRELIVSGNAQPESSAWIKFRGDAHYNDSPDQYYDEDGSGDRCKPSGKGLFDCSFKVCVRKPMAGHHAKENVRVQYFTMCRPSQ